MKRVRNLTEAVIADTGADPRWECWAASEQNLWEREDGGQRASPAAWRDKKKGEITAVSLGSLLIKHKGMLRLKVHCVVFGFF